VVEGHYRLIWPGLVLASQGHDVRVIAPGSREGIAGDINKQTGQIVDLRVPPDADAIVVQRITLRHMADGLALLRERQPHIAVIVDMDDDLRTINPNNPAFRALHTKYGHAVHTGENAMRACLGATLVTVSTPALLKVYAPHGRGVVMYNRVPKGYLDVPHVDSTVMSWPGSIHSHPDDLHQVGPAVARLIQAGHQYVATGSPVGIKDALALPEHPDSCGDVDFDKWPWAVARIGVGLAPLADTVFNAAKSWLKPLELSAMGVPWVASPRAEYVRLHRDHKVGLLAKDRGAWFQRLRALVTDEALRLEQSQAGRAAAAANTVEEHAWRWLEAWQGAVMIARRGAPALRLR
jgi:hypothetical protein